MSRPANDLLEDINNRQRNVVRCCAKRDTNRAVSVAAVTLCNNITLPVPSRDLC